MSPRCGRVVSLKIKKWRHMVQYNHYFGYLSSYTSIGSLDIDCTHETPYFGVVVLRVVLPTPQQGVFKT